MKVIKTPIIPCKQNFVKVKGVSHELDYKAICTYLALGFFLDNDTYWLDTKVLRPATINTIDKDGYLIKSEKWFNWHYSPKEISFKDTVSEFTDLFETIVKEQVGNEKVILPLSGGLDSRTQAIALHKLNSKISSYSYSFQNGYKESNISKKIANRLNIPFKELTISNGYLWNKLDTLATINQCYSEFTHPRQMAVIDEIGVLGDIFSLGHWGDVLFDSDAIGPLENHEILDVLKKKIVKKGGIELAESLWKFWGIDGTFKDFLNERLWSLWNDIKIDNNAAKMRAFKSLYWAPRWTSINLAIFESIKPIRLPYYDDRMCKFICSVPEKFLANRQIQIAYIKNSNPSIAKVEWQDARPFNLYTYHFNKLPYTLPYRAFSKAKRILSAWAGIRYTQRNWEIQFLGKENESKLLQCIFENDFNKNFIPKAIVSNIYDRFMQLDSVTYSHPLSMILTLSEFYRKEKVND